MPIDIGDIPTGTPPTTGEKLQIRTAIGLGQTDAPTFLAASLTGQSLTGTQATSLVDLATTWNTSGTPSAIKLNVVETGINSPAASKLMDLQVGGVSKFSISKGGELAMNSAADPSTYISNPQLGFLFHGGGARSFFLGQNGSGLGLANMSSIGLIGFSSSSVPAWNNSDTLLARDAAGILAQRNGVAKQALRVYNTNLSTAPEWAEFDWITSGTGNTLKIGTNKSGDGVARPIDFVIGGTARMSLSTASDLTVVGSVSTGSGFVFTSKGYIGMSSSGVMSLNNWLGNDFNRIQLGGTLDTHPAIARDGAGIKFTGAAAGSTSWIKVPAVAVSALPSAATAGVGARAFVNDALAPVFGSAVAGLGSVTVPVYSTGSAWNVG
jgi:hypothetical protein